MVTDTCNLAILSAYFVGKTCTLRLATASAALSDVDTLATHAAVSGAGYADAVLVNPTVSLISGIPAVSWDPVSFMFTGVFSGAAADMYLVYADAVLLFANMLPAQIVASNGFETMVTPVFKLGNGTPT